MQLFDCHNEHLRNVLWTLASCQESLVIGKRMIEKQAYLLQLKKKLFYFSCCVRALLDFCQYVHHLQA